MEKFRICRDFSYLQDPKLRQVYTSFLGLPSLNWWESFVAIRYDKESANVAYKEW